MHMETQKTEASVDLNTEATRSGVSTTPEKIIRDGAIAASIWRREGKHGEYFDYTLSRSWKSEESGKSGYAHNYSARNGEQLVNVIKQATDWIKEHGASSTQSEKAGAN